jgi:hypothetical protein
MRRRERYVPPFSWDFTLNHLRARQQSFTFGQEKMTDCDLVDRHRGEVIGHPLIKHDSSQLGTART